MRSHSYGIGLLTTPRTNRRREHQEQSTGPKPIRKADGSLEYPVKREPTDISLEAARSYSAFLESRERLRERGLI